jgi:tetratricopeptide (TPR) repeat protein
MSRRRASGPQLLQIQQAILDHFDENELAELLLELDKRYWDYASRGQGLRRNVLEVVEAAERGRWLVALVKQASTARSGPDFPFRQLLRELDEVSPDHLVVLVAYARPGGDTVADSVRRRLATLPVTVNHWPADGGGTDAQQARAAVDGSDVVVLVITRQSAPEDWLCRYALDRAAATGSEVIALLGPAARGKQPPAGIRTIRIADGAGDGWAELEEHLDFLASPEGLLRALRARRDRLLTEASAAQPRYEAEIRDVDSRIDLQRRRAEDPARARRNTADEIKQGLQRERRPHRTSGPSARIPTFNQPPEEPPTFQDRTDELLLIGRLLLDPAIRLVALTGRDGIGKTGLVSHLWNQLLGGGLQVRVDGLVYLPAHGFVPVTATALLRALVRVTPIGDLERLEERLRLPIPMSERADEVLAALSNRTVVVVLDNAEDLLDDAGDLRDLDLRGLVGHLVRHANHGVRLVLVGKELPARLLQTLPKPATRAEPLHGLTCNDTHTLLCALDTERVFDFDRASEHEKGLLHHLTKGTPRALELAFALLRARPEKTLAWLLDEMDRTTEPDMVRFLFGEVFGRLARDQQRVVQALAAYARPVDAGAVDDLLQHYVDGAASEVILESLHARRLVRRDGDRYYLPYFPDGEWVLGQLQPGAPEDRRRPPRRLTRLALLHLAAEHFAAARKPEDAVARVEDLTAQFNEIDLRIRGREHERAQELIEVLDDQYLNRWGYSDAVIPMLDELAPGLAGNRDRQVRRLSRLAEAYRQRECPAQAIDRTKEALALLRRFSDKRYHMALNAQWGAALLDLGRISDAVAHYRRTLWWAARYRNRYEGAKAHGGLALCYGRAGMFGRARRHHDRAVSLLQRSRKDDLDSLGPRLQLNVCWVYSQLGQHGPAWQAMQAALAAARDQDNRLVEGLSLVLKAQLLIDEGGVHAAIEAAGAAAEIGVRANNGRLCRVAKEVLTLACLYDGDLDQAYDAVDVPGRSNGTPLGLGLRGIVAYRRDDRDEAGRAFAAADERVQQQRRAEARDFQLLDTHGLVLTGLAIVDVAQRGRHLAAAEEAFRRSRKLAPSGHGAVLRTMQLLNQLAVGADAELIERARGAVGSVIRS